MAAAERTRLRCQPLLSRLKKFGVFKARQNGSHVVLLKPISPGSKKGPTYPFPCPRPTAEVSHHYIDAILRRFEIDAADFWSK